MMPAEGNTLCFSVRLSCREECSLLLFTANKGMAEVIGFICRQGDLDKIVGGGRMGAARTVQYCIGLREVIKDGSDRCLSR